MANSMVSLLSAFGRITAAIRRRFTRQKYLTAAELQAEFDALGRAIAARYAEQVDRHIADMAAAKAEHVEARRRLETETESLRILVNAGLAKAKARNSLFLNRN